MESPTMVRAKSLRDIWAAADKSTIETLQAASGLCRNVSDNRTSEVQGLFQHDDSDDDNISLKSIWSPTNNDNLKNAPKNFPGSSLIDLEMSNDLKPQNLCKYPASDTWGTYESPLINLEIPINSQTRYNRYNLAEDYASESCENPLIDLETPKNSPAKHPNAYTFSKNYPSKPCESLLIDLGMSENSKSKMASTSLTPYTHGIGSNQVSRNLAIHHSDSEKSLDELNEETFGEFHNISNESELTLSDISEATAAYKLNKDQVTQEVSNNEPRVFECSGSLKDMLEVQEIATGTKPKTAVKVYRQNNLQPYPRKDGKRINHENSRDRNETSKFLSSNKSNMSSNSEEILSLGQENVTIHEIHPQNNYRRYSPNERKETTNRTHETLHRISPNRGGVAIRTRETFHKISPNERGVATRTCETFHTEDNISYYKTETEKITYVRGEKIENKSKRLPKNPQNIIWRNSICDLSDANDAEIIANNNIKNKKYQDDYISPYHNNKGVNGFNIKSNCNECECCAENSSGFKNRNNGKHRELKQFDCADQETRPKHLDNSNEEMIFNHSSRDEIAAEYIWQSSADKSNEFIYEEPTNKLQVKASRFTIGYNQRSNAGERTNEKQNVTHFKIYDPKLHRPSKKKIDINKNSAYMKFKSSSSSNPQNGKTTPSNESSIRSSINKNLKEQYEFFENHNVDKAVEDSKPYIKDVMKDINLTRNNAATDIPELENSTTVAKNDNKKLLKSSMIHDAKEIADLIVGSERALDLFKSFYYEWVELRKQSISLLEQIVMIINQSSRKSDTMKHIVTAINIAGIAANLIPHPNAALGAKVAGAVGGFFSNFFNRTDSKKDVGALSAKEYEIREIFQRDIDSSSYVYIYGVQCGSQFQETCTAISKFHKRLLEGNFSSVTADKGVLEFVNEICQYNNSNTFVFYKRLHMCYERLINNVNSEDSRAFVRVFEDVPNAIDVINLLPWKFDSDGFDNSIVQNAWDDLFLLFLDGNTATVDIIKKKIENCLLFLKKERAILTRNVVDIFKD